MGSSGVSGTLVKLEGRAGLEVLEFVVKVERVAGRAGVEGGTSVGGTGTRSGTGGGLGSGGFLAGDVEEVVQGVAISGGGTTKSGVTGST